MPYGMTPFFRSSSSESRLDGCGSGQGDWADHDNKEASHAGTDCARARMSRPDARRWQRRRFSLPRAWRVRAELLPVAKPVRRLES